MGYSEILEKRISICHELRDIAKQKNISVSEIERKTGILESNIHRIFTGKHAPKLDIIIRICEVLDIEIKFN